MAQAKAGSKDATLIYAQDDLLLIGVILTAGDGTELVFCTFDDAKAGKPAYKGESFFGTVSELRDDDFPELCYADCALEKK